MGGRRYLSLPPPAGRYGHEFFTPLVIEQVPASQQTPSPQVIVPGPGFVQLIVQLVP